MISHDEAPRFPVWRGLRSKWFQKELPLQNQMFYPQFSGMVEVKNWLWSFPGSILQPICDFCIGKVKWILHNMGPFYDHHHGEICLPLQLSHHLFPGWRLFFIVITFSLFSFRPCLLGEMHSCPHICNRVCGGFVFLRSPSENVVVFCRWLWSVSIM